ncbi:hypothetical protein CDD81_6968 [Ophiocordyceps australis]|uniref:Uncharacterized protein n=1 Tax=Ophiocordyceps australis TaxID=1399860 RepID=A0A2C5YFU6_9HYPO|nr:hypothetical protein CDD81_6968 [Ophiocordyceps australis]
MFAGQHHYGQVISESGRKRTRDDDALSLVTGFGEHRNKRLHSLPLRTSRMPTSAATPEHVPCSDSTFANMRCQSSSPWSSESNDARQMQNTITEFDMMDVTDSYASCRDQSRRAAIPHDALGRMPTPIQPSFAAQVRGQHCEWAGPGPAVKSFSGIINLGHHQTGFSDDEYLPRAVPSNVEWHTVQNNRRLPSPISEMSDPSKHQTQMTIDEQPSDGLSEAMDQDMECQLHPQKPFELDHEPASPSHGRRGHTRSKHTVNTWTWQPGMKKSFSIGYRPDCEKCRLNVPGHFNHIIIS